MMPLDYAGLRQQIERLDELNPTQRRTVEQRLRRMAQRQGLALRRSPRKDPYAPDYGRYRLDDAAQNHVVAGGTPWPFSLSLQETALWLLGEPVTAEGSNPPAATITVRKEHTR